MGHSRFDFFVIDAQGQRHLIEVKACSLVENGVAMFPDAPSDRASKHLEELAALTDSGYRCHIVFMIVHGNPRVFMPNPHTDPLFTSTLSRLSPKLHIHAVLLSAAADGFGRITSTDVPIDLSYGTLAEEDRGSYMMLLHLPQNGHAQIGQLGEFDFPQGWYVYAGSAQRNLKARIARHQRRVKQKLHWHLDYLSPYADKIIALPVAGYTNLECQIAQALADLGGRPFRGFGSSDCGCPSHLYYFADPPLKDRTFVDLLLQARHVWALGCPPIG
jgi:sugar fermentation stimulation protein A